MGEHRPKDSESGAAPPPANAGLSSHRKLLCVMAVLSAGCSISIIALVAASLTDSYDNNCYLGGPVYSYHSYYSYYEGNESICSYAYAAGAVGLAISLITLMQELLLYRRWRTPLLEAVTCIFGVLWWSLFALIVSIEAAQPLADIEDERRVGATFAERTSVVALAYACAVFYAACTYHSIDACWYRIKEMRAARAEARVDTALKSQVEAATCPPVYHMANYPSPPVASIPPDNGDEDEEYGTRAVPAQARALKGKAPAQPGTVYPPPPTAGAYRPVAPPPAPAPAPLPASPAPAASGVYVPPPGFMLVPVSAEMVTAVHAAEGAAPGQGAPLRRASAGSDAV